MKVTFLVEQRSRHFGWQFCSFWFLKSSHLRWPRTVKKSDVFNQRSEKSSDVEIQPMDKEEF